MGNNGKYFLGKHQHEYTIQVVPERRKHAYLVRTGTSVIMKTKYFDSRRASANPVGKSQKLTFSHIHSISTYFVDSHYQLALSNVS